MFQTADLFFLLVCSEVSILRKMWSSLASAHKQAASAVSAYISPLPPLFPWFTQRICVISNSIYSWFMIRYSGILTHLMRREVRLGVNRPLPNQWGSTFPNQQPVKTQMSSLINQNIHLLLWVSNGMIPKCPFLDNAHERTWNGESQEDS